MGLGVLVALSRSSGPDLPPIEVPQRDAELQLTCMDCASPTHARIRGPRSMTVTLPARITLPVGTYEVVGIDDILAPVDVTLGSDERVRRRPVADRSLGRHALTNHSSPGSSSPSFTFAHMAGPIARVDDGVALPELELVAHRLCCRSCGGCASPSP